MTYAVEIKNRLTVRFDAIHKRTNKVRKGREDFDLASRSKEAVHKSLMKKLVASYPNETITITSVDRWP